MNYYYVCWNCPGGFVHQLRRKILVLFRTSYPQAWKKNELDKIALKRCNRAFLFCKDGRHETHLSAFRSQAQTYPRLSSSHAYPWWACGYSGPSRQGANPPRRLMWLQRRMSITASAAITGCAKRMNSHPFLLFAVRCVAGISNSCLARHQVHRRGSASWLQRKMSARPLTATS